MRWEYLYLCSFSVSLPSVSPASSLSFPVSYASLLLSRSLSSSRSLSFSLFLSLSVSPGPSDLLANMWLLGGAGTPPILLSLNLDTFGTRPRTRQSSCSLKVQTKFITQRDTQMIQSRWLRATSWKHLEDATQCYFRHTKRLGGDTYLIINKFESSGRQMRYEAFLSYLSLSVLPKLSPITLVPDFHQKRHAAPFFLQAWILTSSDRLSFCFLQQVWLSFIIWSELLSCDGQHLNIQAQRHEDCLVSQSLCTSNWLDSSIILHQSELINYGHLFGANSDWVHHRDKQGPWSWSTDLLLQRFLVQLQKGRTGLASLSLVSRSCCGSMLYVHGQNGKQRNHGLFALQAVSLECKSLSCLRVVFPQSKFSVNSHLFIVERRDVSACK